MTHYISSSLFYVVFLIVASLTLFLGANDRSHAKPYRFFIAALLSIAFGFCFKIANDKIEESVIEKQTAAQRLEAEAKVAVSVHNLLESKTKIEEARKLKADARFMSEANGPFKHLVDAILLVSGAFAGALASAAITNRAKFMHDARTLDFLRSLYSQREVEAHGLSTVIKRLLSSPDVGPHLLKQVEEKKSQLTSTVREMELLSSQLTQREIDAIGFMRRITKSNSNRMK